MPLVKKTSFMDRVRQLHPRNSDVMELSNFDLLTSADGIFVICCQVVNDIVQMNNTPAPEIVGEKCVDAIKNASKGFDEAAQDSKDANKNLKTILAINNENLALDVLSREKSKESNKATTKSLNSLKDINGNPTTINIKDYNTGELSTIEELYKTIDACKMEIKKMESEYDESEKIYIEIIDNLEDRIKSLEDENVKLKKAESYGLNNLGLFSHKENNELSNNAQPQAFKTV